MRIRLIAAAGATAAALTLGIALPAAADGHADVAAAKRAVKKVKVYQDANFKNRNTTFTENMRNLKKDGWNDTISSAKNLGNRRVTFYQHKNYTGASFSLKPHHKEAHFGHHAGMSDATSSIEFD
ncbi:peptidase inhibitor family I36 protein [Streptomyces sp. Je 1-4]|uniref:peptidase inhibitor family I36 protein n=1 Tax=Streptomyces TaxID=1883 RepID=UPI0021D7DDF7|nr:MULTISPECIES: peptidase inhibitor family I36 protein [unclassified Streptomyces]UYB39123.1 peptidase inhibitor family I36 protein [Streptomyces sp. Je 1-4]UZQ35131.1 peptidase inhibitor family I36 protein [Streptomyces sp. Je 1-4] [Streptomyces sp. Je 1-4 4N24]UZQ42549.1 peptidase inhibitor family I36 protein [Streptomyces sp. Je 1-4] [Streptomyces sp. Je 1-4 4N24_ara]